MEKNKKRGVWLELTASDSKIGGEKTGEYEAIVVSARCSECRSISYNLTQWTTRMAPFCPHCGAQMGVTE